MHVVDGKFSGSPDVREAVAVLGNPSPSHALHLSVFPSTSIVGELRGRAEKEREAHDNLGDEGALLGLYDPEREADFVANSISARANLDTEVGSLKAERAEAEDQLGPNWLLDLLAEISEERPVLETAATPPSLLPLRRGVLSRGPRSPRAHPRRGPPLAGPELAPRARRGELPRAARLPAAL